MTQPPSQSRRLNHFNVSSWTILTVILFVLAVIIWGTLGLRTTALYEDWGTFHLYDNGASPLDPTLVGQSSRPFQEVGTWIGYAIDSNSFVGLNLYAIIMFFAQGIILFALIYRLRPKDPLFALSVTILFLIYPADNSLANSRYTTYHWCIFFFLLSVYFLIDYWQRRRWYALVGMFVTTIFSLGVVEVTYPLILVTPLLLVWLVPSKRITRRVVRVSALWYLAPLAMILQASLSYSQGTQVYQEYLLSTTRQIPLLTHLINYVGSLFHAYLHILYDSWRNSLNQIDIQSGRFLFALLIIVLCGIGLWILYRFTVPNSPIASTQVGLDKNRYSSTSSSLLSNSGELFWFITGLLIVGLGFAIYAYLPTHQSDTERVYLLSSLGGALTLTAASFWVGHRFNRGHWFTIIIISVLTGLALQNDLVDVLRAKTASEQEQGLLAQIVEQVPDPVGAKAIIIIDNTHQLTTSMSFATLEYPGFISSAVNYLYHTHTLGTRVCDQTQMIGSPPRPACIIGLHDITFPSDSSFPDTVYPIKEVFVFEYSNEGQLKLLTQWSAANAQSDNPMTVRDPQAPLPPRTYTMFSHWPFQMQTPLNEHPVHTLNFSGNSVIMFLDHPTLPYINYGWVGNWTSGTRSTLNVWLNSDSDYQIKIVISHSTLPETVKHLSLMVNDQPISITTRIDTNQVLTLTGTIPREVIARNLTGTSITLLSYPITSPLAAGAGTAAYFLGFQVDQLTVASINVAHS